MPPSAESAPQPEAPRLRPVRGPDVSGAARPQACPFVAFDDDRDKRSEAPDPRHRCFAVPNPEPRAIAHQQAYCLTPNFPSCAFFMDWAGRCGRTPGRQWLGLRGRAVRRRRLRFVWGSVRPAGATGIARCGGSGRPPVGSPASLGRRSGLARHAAAATAAVDPAAGSSVNSLGATRAADGDARTGPVRGRSRLRPHRRHAAAIGQPGAPCEGRRGGRPPDGQPAVQSGSGHPAGALRGVPGGRSGRHRAAAGAGASAASDSRCSPAI